MQFWHFLLKFAKKERLKRYFCIIINWILYLVKIYREMPILHCLWEINSVFLSEENAFLNIKTLKIMLNKNFFGTNFMQLNFKLIY